VSIGAARRQVEQLRDQLCAIVYQLVIARAYADVVDDLLATGDDQDRLYAIERLQWVRKWMALELVGLDHASTEFKRMVLPVSVLPFVDPAAADQLGRSAATNATPRT
jgi:hypothetical protein